jgi:hypothetical protein
MTDESRRAGEVIAIVFGVLLHLVVGFFYLVSGLVAPLWALAVLWVIWLALAYLMWRWRTKPFVVLAIPFVAAAIWWGVITLGDVLLGWTA